MYINRTVAPPLASSASRLHMRVDCC